MKKNLLLFLIALFCILFANAQTEKQIPLPNEEFFTQADLVIEGIYLREVHTYNLEGTSKFEDCYRICSFKVIRVYKGDPSLTDSIIYVVRKGAYLGSEKKYDDGSVRTVSSELPYLLAENGVSQGVNFFTPSIYFFKNSDYAEDANSKYATFPKYKYVIDYIGGRMYYDMMFVVGDKIIGLDSLVFHTHEDFYNYIKQFRGFTVPEIPKRLEGLENGTELDNSNIAPVPYERK